MLKQWGRGNTQNKLYTYSALHCMCPEAMRGLAAQTKNYRCDLRMHLAPDRIKASLQGFILIWLHLGGGSIRLHFLARRSRPSKLLQGLPCYLHQDLRRGAVLPLLTALRASARLRQYEVLTAQQKVPRQHPHLWLPQLLSFLQHTRPAMLTLSTSSSVSCSSSGSSMAESIMSSIISSITPAYTVAGPL